jgi:glycosyltransferase involved in cell wall biosynthesis
VQECRRLVDDRGLQILEMEDAHGTAHGVRRRLSIPVVVRLHGPWFLNGPFHGSTDSPAFRERVEAEGRGIASADLITSPSFDVLERTRDYYGLELPGAVVFPPPTEMVADEDRWNLENSDRNQILFIGRFDRHKGGDLMIDAFAEVARRKPDAKLRFVGPDRGLALDDGSRVGIEDYIREKAPEAAGRIERLGQVPSGELGRLRRQARVTVVCSRYETFGLTLTEAVTSGCPTVATRVGAFVEIVQDGVNGLLCAPENPTDLADRIVALLDDDGLAAKLGRQAAIDGRNRYEASHLALQASEHYARLIKGRNRMGRGVTPR